MKNIYVANLSYRVTNDDLKKVFEEFGEVISAKVIIDQLTGRSRGFGFVEMTNPAEADKAIEELNKAIYDGKEMAVSEARPRTERKSNDFNSNRQGGGGYNKKRY